MNTSLSWMKMYVPDLDVTAQEYTDAMTLSGTKVEGFTKLDADLDKIVIGQIERLEPYGKGNRKPLFAQAAVPVRRAQILGRNKRSRRRQRKISWKYFKRR